MKLILIFSILMLSFVICRELERQDNCICENEGVCVSGICQCTEQYAGMKCDYERKHKKTAFLLGFFAGGWGADRFYLGYNGAGAAKLILSILPCFGLCGSVLLMRANDRAVVIGIISSLLTYFALVLWWMVDWILILRGQLNDSDGYSLY